MEVPGTDATVVVRQEEIAASNARLEQKTLEFFFNLRKFSHAHEWHKGTPDDDPGQADGLSLGKAAFQ